MTNNKAEQGEQEQGEGNAAQSGGPGDPLYSSPDDGLRGAATPPIAPARDAIVKELAGLLRRAEDWIIQKGHGDPCGIGDDSIPMSQRECTCGRDSLLVDINTATLPL